MELSSCSCKTLLLAILIVDSQFLHGLGCVTETGSRGATRDGAKQLGNGEANVLRLRLRLRSAQTHEAAQAQHGRGQGAAARPSGTSGASDFPAVIPPSDAGGFGPRPREDGQTFETPGTSAASAFPAVSFGPRQREDGQTFETPAFESVARKLLQGVVKDASSKSSCDSNYAGCPH